MNTSDNAQKKECRRFGKIKKKEMIFASKLIESKKKKYLTFLSSFQDLSELMPEYFPIFFLM